MLNKLIIFFCAMLATLLLISLIESVKSYGITIDFFARGLGFAILVIVSITGDFVSEK